MIGDIVTSLMAFTKVFHQNRVSMRGLDNHEQALEVKFGTDTDVLKCLYPSHR